MGRHPGGTNAQALTVPLEELDERGEVLLAAADGDGLAVEARDHGGDHRGVPLLGGEVEDEADVLRRQAGLEPGPVVPLEHPGPVVDEVRGAAARSGEDVEEPLRLHPALHPEHERLGGGGDVAERHEVVHQLHRLGGADPAAGVVDGARQRLEQRTAGVEQRLVAADHEDELALRRLGRLPGEGHVERAHAPPLRLASDLLHRVGVDRARLDQNGAGGHRVEDAVVAEAGGEHARRVGEGGDQHRHRRGELACRAGDPHAHAAGVLARLRGQVVPGDLPSAVEEAAGHSAPDVPQSQQPDLVSHAPSPPLCPAELA